MNDTLGDLMKDLEAKATIFHDANQPLYVRLDGRSFSKVTKNEMKPFSEEFIELMQNTTEELMREFSADVGFCQSDEISLVFLPRNVEGFVYPFRGKQSKIQSVLAAHATYFFAKNYWNDSVINFDARSLSMTYQDAALMLMWRHKDATRNAILQYAHNSGHLTKSSLHGQKTSEVVLRLIESGVPWDEISPAFRMGTFFLNEREDDKRYFQQYHVDRSYHFVYDYMINKYKEN